MCDLIIVSFSFSFVCVLIIEREGFIFMLYVCLIKTLKKIK